MQRSGRCGREDEATRQEQQLYGADERCGCGQAHVRCIAVGARGRTDQRCRMEYIEAELRKRKPAGTAMEVEKEIRSLDPRDELYKIAEKYKVDKQEVEEGNVALSAGMLTVIPEVDLGMKCVDVCPGSERMC